jgi:surface protein
MDKLRKASEGKTKSQSGMNMDEIKEYLLSLPGADKKKINVSSRLGLDRLLKIAINDNKVVTPKVVAPKVVAPKVVTPKVVTPKVVTHKVVSPKVVYITSEELKLDLRNTTLPAELSKIILRYTETIIKVQFDDTKIVYLSKNEFNDLGCQNVTHVDICGVLVMKDPESKFYYSKIQTISGPVVLIGNASDMFYNAKSFNSDLSKWNTSQVTNMSSMFCDAMNFNSDISNWDTSKVTDMSVMFYYATNFNSDISRWDTSNVTDMINMFFRAENFNSDISRWDTSNVTNMSGMFYGAINFNKDISRWDTSKVTDMEYMFSSATNFNQDLSVWDTSKVENMRDMFKGATNFTGSVKKVEGVWKIIY